MTGVFNRAVKGPAWTQGPQHNDSLFMRDTGWLQLFSETAQGFLDEEGLHAVGRV